MCRIKNIRTDKKLLALTTWLLARWDAAYEQYLQSARRAERIAEEGGSFDDEGGGGDDEGDEENLRDALLQEHRQAADAWQAAAASGGAAAQPLVLTPANYFMELMAWRGALKNKLKNTLRAEWEAAPLKFGTLAKRLGGTAADAGWAAYVAEIKGRLMGEQLLLDEGLLSEEMQVWWKARQRALFSELASFSWDGQPDAMRALLNDLILSLREGKTSPPQHVPTRIFPVVAMRHLRDVKGFADIVLVEYQMLYDELMHWSVLGIRDKILAYFEKNKTELKHLAGLKNSTAPKVLSGFKKHFDILRSSSAEVAKDLVHVEVMEFEVRAWVKRVAALPVLRLPVESANSVLHELVTKEGDLADRVRVDITELHALFAESEAHIKVTLLEALTTKVLDGLRALNLDGGDAFLQGSGAVLAHLRLYQERVALAAHGAKDSGQRAPADDLVEDAVLEADDEEEEDDDDAEGGGAAPAGRGGRGGRGGRPRGAAGGRARGARPGAGRGGRGAEGVGRSGRRGASAGASARRGRVARRGGAAGGGRGAGRPDAAVAAEDERDDLEDDLLDVAAAHRSGAPAGVRGAGTRAIPAGPARKRRRMVVEESTEESSLSSPSLMSSDSEGESPPSSSSQPRAKSRRQRAKRRTKRKTASMVDAESSSSSGEGSSDSDYKRGEKKKSISNQTRSPRSGPYGH